MPQVIPALIAAAGTVAVAFIQGAVGGLVGLFIKSFVVFAALGGLSQALAKKPKGASPAGQEARSRMQTVRSPIEPRRVVFGQVMVSGPLAYMEVSGSGNEYLHLIVMLAGHEIHSINDVYFDDNKVGAQDGSGNVTAGKYSGKARIRRLLGAASQVADTDLVSESAGKWTSDDRLRGIAALYVRLRRDDTVYVTGAPQVRAVVRGLKVYDPRDGVTRFTENPALLLRSYLLSPLGLGCTTGELDESSFSAAANACEERVAVATYNVTAAATFTSDIFTLGAAENRLATGDGVQLTTTGTLPAPLALATTYYVIRLSPTVVQLASSYQNAIEGVAIDLANNGSGAHTLNHVNQARYTCNGTVSLDQTPREIVAQILQSMQGALVFTAGQYVVRAGVWNTPTITLTDADLRGGVSLRERVPRQELFNGVRGIYMDPQKFWQPTDFPPVRNSTYETEDGGVQIMRDVEMPMVNNVVRAQRLAKITLARARQSRVLTLQCNLRAFRMAVWDTVYVTIPSLQLSAAPHRVIAWKLSGEDGLVGVDLVLQAEDANVYGWSSTDATYIPQQPDLFVPELPFNPGGVPSGTVLPGGATEGDVFSLTTDGKIYRFKSGAWVTWVDGSDILAASITAGKLAANSIVAGDGVIGALAVDTLQIADQAVTIPTAAYTSGGTSVGGSFSTVQSITVNSTGAPILLTGSLSMASSLVSTLGAGAVRLTRGATVVSASYTVPRGFVSVTDYEVRGTVAFQLVDTPGAGTFTYNLQASCSVSAIVTARSLSALEVKK